MTNNAQIHQIYVCNWKIAEAVSRWYQILCYVYKM